MTANELKALRKSLKLTQRELSMITQIPISTIRHWEQGIHKISEQSAYYILYQLNEANKI